MSIKLELQKRIMNDMIAASRGNDKAIVLNVDLHSSKILSSCCRMFDVMEAGVVVVENIELGRQRLDLPVIYFVTPTEKIVDRLITDYTDPKHPQYGPAHVFFTSRCPDSLLQRIRNFQPLVNALRTLVDFYVDFAALESHVFSCDQEDSLAKLFMPTSEAALTDSLQSITKHLVSLCLTMHEFPHVRYMESSAMSRTVGQQLEGAMKDLIRDMPEWKSNEKRGTLLIVDRTVDLVAPLMHEFTYQAMINDLLRVRGELCFLPSNMEVDEKEKDKDKSKSDGVVLSEDDNLWRQYRHQHISEVLRAVRAELRAFSKQNAAVQQLTSGAEDGSGPKPDIKELGAVVKGLGAYKEMVKKYDKHLTLATACMEINKQFQLQTVGGLEQDIATGFTEEAAKVNERQMKETMSKVCLDPQLPAIEKLRIIMIYLLSWGGLQDAVRNQLMRGMDPVLDDCIKNLSKLGADVTTLSSGKIKLPPRRIEQLQQRIKTATLVGVRYLPGLQPLIDATVSYNLSEDEFPYVTPPPETERENMQAKQGRSVRRKANADWKKDDAKDNGAGAGGAGGKGGDDDQRPRFIIFVLGGITHSEMRAAYEIAEQQKANVYIGGTSVLTPSQYLIQLSAKPRRAFVDAVMQSGPNVYWLDEHKYLMEEEEREKKKQQEREEAEAAAKARLANGHARAAAAAARERRTGCLGCIDYLNGK